MGAVALAGMLYTGFELFGDFFFGIVPVELAWLRWLAFAAFGVAALWFLGTIGRELLCALHPRIELLPCRVPAPGEEVEIAWRFDRPTTRLRDLRVHLESRRYAPDADASTTPRREHVGTQYELLDTVGPVTFVEPERIASGSARFAIPAQARPSWRKRRRWFVWMVVFEASVAGLPDYREEVEIRVRDATAS